MPKTRKRKVATQRKPSNQAKKKRKVTSTKRKTKTKKKITKRKTTKKMKAKTSRKTTTKKRPKTSAKDERVTILSIAQAAKVKLDSRKQASHIRARLRKQATASVRKKFHRPGQKPAWVVSKVTLKKVATKGGDKSLWDKFMGFFSGSSPDDNALKKVYKNILKNLK